MKVETNELIKALTRVKTALSQKDLVPEMTHFIFNGEMVTTYDDQISISYPFKTDFEFTVKGNDFLDVVSNLDPEKDTEITKTKDNKLKIKQGKKNLKIAKFVTTSKEESIVQTHIDALFDSMDDGFLDLPDSFVQGVQMCFPCASGDQTAGLYACVHFEGSHIAASDQHRCVVFDTGTELSDTFNIKASAAQKLVNYEVKYYLVTEIWVHFMTEGGTIFSARKVESEDEYPDFMYLIEDLSKVKNTVKLPENIGELIDFTSTMTEKDVHYRKTKVTIEGKNFRMFSTLKGRGSAQASLKLEKPLSKNKIEFTINPSFLAYVAGSAKTLKYKEEKALIETGSFKYLLAMYAED